MPGFFKRKSKTAPEVEAIKSVLNSPQYAQHKAEKKAREEAEAAEAVAATTTSEGGEDIFSQLDKSLEESGVKLGPRASQVDASLQPI